jgi:hypothetical protein
LGNPARTQGAWFLLCYLIRIRKCIWPLT